MPQKKPTKKEPPNRSGTPVTVYIDSDVRAAMDTYISEHNETAEHKASIRSTVEAALKRYLKESGHWPPKPSK